MAITHARKAENLADRAFGIIAPHLPTGDAVGAGVFDVNGERLPLDTVAAMAQVHATLAVAQALRDLNETFRLTMTRDLIPAIDALTTVFEEDSDSDSQDGAK